MMDQVGPHRLLVVDDEEAICEALQDYFESNGYVVDTALNGDEMHALLDNSPVDLVILDLMMPGDDGLSLTKQLREKSNVGIVILTGRDNEADRILGLEMGADDFIAKPFSARELLARVKTVLRRTGEIDGNQNTREIPVVSFAGWKFDRIARRLTSPGGKPVTLTTMEFNLLSVFVLYPNEVLDRDRLLDLLQKRHWEPEDRSVDVLVGRLRSKIESDSKNPDLIKTVRGEGYVLAAMVEPVHGESAA